VDTGTVQDAATTAPASVDTVHGITGLTPSPAVAGDTGPTLVTPIAATGAPTPGVDATAAVPAVIPPPGHALLDGATNAAPAVGTPPTSDHLPFPFDLPDATVLAHGLASLEAKLLLGSMVAAYVAGRASGLGMFDFSQPALQACTNSMRMTFTQVKLVSCRERDLAHRSVAAVSNAVAERTRSAGANARGQLSTVRGSVAAARHAIGPWTVPAASLYLLRLIACVLASLSALIAGASGVRRAKRERELARYRGRRS
jgi:hypothetical protein